MRDLEELFAALRRSRFRSRFRLGPSERRYLEKNGLDRIVIHARRLVSERLGPAKPRNDGRQTPMRGHPVFVAQHATATCCRGCLAKWHRIAAGSPLSEGDLEHILRVLRTWLERELLTKGESLHHSEAGNTARQMSLFERDDENRG